MKFVIFMIFVVEYACKNVYTFCTSLMQVRHILAKNNFKIMATVTINRT